MNKLHKGQISFGRSSGGASSKEFRLEIMDDASRIHFLVARFDSDAFADLMTNRFAKVEFEVMGLELIGAISEHKTELIKFDCYNLRFSKERKGLESSDRSPGVDKLLAPYEADGWTARVSDLFNGHNRKDGDKQAVSFFRYVDSVTKKPFLPKQ
jgi:hypothetical protein